MMALAAPDLTEVALRLVGAFYAFAGVVTMRAGIASRFIDVATAAIGGEAAKPAETGRAFWMLVAGIVVLAGGVALALRVDLAAILFTVSALAQAVYLGFVAPRLLDPSDPPDAMGRQQTINAFVLYLAATAYVLWAYLTGRLDSWHSLPWPILPLAATVVGAYAGYALIKFFKPMAG